LAVHRGSRIAKTKKGKQFRFNPALLQSKRKSPPMKGFKQFLLRGNILDLAIAVLIGAAFGAVVSSFVKDLMTPLIAALFGQPDFSNLSFSVNQSRVAYGNFLNSFISLLMVGAAIYYFIVVPINTLKARGKSTTLSETDKKTCPECLSEIPFHARRCSFCTTALAAVSEIRTGT
jgi:large conductance mechanosensitive channel